MAKKKKLTPEQVAMLVELAMAIGALIKECREDDRPNERQLRRRIRRMRGRDIALVACSCEDSETLGDALGNARRFKRLGQALGKEELSDAADEIVDSILD